jgi:glutathione synthase
MVNDVQTEQPGYTTVRLAMQAINKGFDSWYIGAGDFVYDTDEKIHAFARSVTKKSYKSTDVFLEDLKGPKARVENITVDDLDVLMLRSDPSTDTGDKTWAQTAGINFGRVAMRHGVIVLNDPNGLAKAMNKMYFQLFPAWRVRDLIGHQFSVYQNSTSTRFHQLP